MVGIITVHEFAVAGDDMRQPEFFAIALHALIKVYRDCSRAFVPAKPVLSLLVCAAVMATWSSPGLAVQVIAGSGNPDVQGEQP